MVMVSGENLRLSGCLMPYLSYTISWVLFPPWRSRWRRTRTSIAIAAASWSASSASTALCPSIREWEDMAGGVGRCCSLRAQVVRQ
jgi:hypothetical protein